MERVTTFAKEVYKDLDDRHMLIPAIVLVVAIVAVPFLLGGGSSTDSAPVPPAADAAPASMTGSEEVEPVVLADVPGLRDYRERLDRFDARDPFVQQMTGSSKSSTDSTTEGTGSGTDTSSSSSSSSTSSSSSSSTPPATDTGSTGTGGTTPTEPELKLIEITLDVKVGKPGKAKVLEDVKPLTLLPGRETPVVQYVQGDVAATKAGFILSPKVITSEGDGKCDPGRNDCEFLVMKKGDVQFFEYGDRLKTFKLEILAINRRVIDADEASKAARRAARASQASANFVASLQK